MTATPQSRVPEIPLYRAELAGNERRYLGEVLDSTWVSGRGPFGARFEAAFAAATGAAHAVSACNGTAALHLALHCLGLTAGDEVLVPSLTFIASANTIAQTGATPVFVESRADTWLMDVDDARRKLTPRTRAIMAVHLYGAVCDMTALCTFADTHGLEIVEDCAEAMGATQGGRHVGTFGKAGAFSFFGNKTVTTGEGGMVITADPALAQRLRRVKGQGHAPDRRYWHIETGFNYRLSDLCAAVGVAQLERLGDTLARKRRVAASYRRLLADMPVTLQARADDTVGADWLVTVLVPDDTDRDGVIAAMAAAGIETRPTFNCVHLMPMYAAGLSLPVAEDIARRGISLPSYPAMTDDDIGRVVAALRAGLQRAG